jgi:DNA mismatch repair ATPase MutL
MLADAPVSAISSFAAPFVLTKDMLTSLRVVAQFEKNFILCRLPAAARRDGSGDSDSGRGRGRGGCNADVLVVVDQHAADERVRFEVCGFVRIPCGRPPRP